MKIVAFWFSQKKMDKLKFDTFACKYESDDLMFKQLDLNISLEEQGPFDMLVHFGLDLVGDDHKDLSSKNQFENLQDFMIRHPEVIYIDDLKKMLALGDREYMMKRCTEVVNDPQIKDRCFMPNYVTIQDNPSREKLLSIIQQHELKFPIVCKPTVAQGIALCHQMMIVMNESNLSELTTPCIMQNFHNHSATLHKLYVLGSNVLMRIRGSVKDLEAGDGSPIRFHTFEVSKLDSKSLMSQMNGSNDCQYNKVDKELLFKIGTLCRKVTGLEMMSADVIVDNISGKYALLDINCFPGFQGIDFCQYFERYARNRLNLPVKETNS